MGSAALLTLKMDQHDIDNAFDDLKSKLMEAASPVRHETPGEMIPL